MIDVLLVLLYLFLLIASILLFFQSDIRRFFERRRYRQRVYKALHFYAEENDQLLINNCCLILPGERKATRIDHILLADKYVYVVKDFYQDGAIYGNLEDPYLFHQDSSKKKEKIENPVLENREVIEKLKKLIGVEEDSTLFVNVVCYNKSLLLPPEMVRKEQGLFFLSTTELEETIKDAEKDEILPIAHEKSEKLIQMLKDRSEGIKSEYRKQGQKIR